jgi:hypothetical protein
LAKIVKAVKTFEILVNLVIAGTLAELEFRVFIYRVGQHENRRSCDVPT